MCFLFLQKTCFCWKLTSPRVCWCLESSHPRGKADVNEANCNIPAGLSGYVNHWLDLSRRRCACQNGCYIETSCVMLQNSLLRWWTVTYSVLAASPYGLRFDALSLWSHAAVHRFADCVPEIPLQRTFIQNTCIVGCVPQAGMIIDSREKFIIAFFRYMKLEPCSSAFREKRSVSSSSFHFILKHREAVR